MVVYFVSRDAAWQKYRGDIMQKLAQLEGCQVVILTSGRLRPYLQHGEGVRYVSFRSWLPPNSRAGFFPGAIGHVVRHRPDVVLAVNNISHFTEYALFPICKALGIRFVWWTHGYDHVRRKERGLRRIAEAIRRKVMRWALHHADGVITFSEAGRQRLISEGLDAGKIVQAPNTLDTDALFELAERYPRAERDRWCQELGLDPQKRYALFVGRLNPLKRPTYAVQVFRRIKEVHANAQFLIVGDGPERLAVADYIRREAVSGVHLLGAVYDDERLARLFTLSEVLLMPANLGLVVVHAFCFGLPIVTERSATHGPEIEYLADGENGWMVEASRPQETADRAQLLLADSGLWSRMSANARQTAVADADVRVMVKSMYKCLVGHERSQPQSVR